MKKGKLFKIVPAYFVKLADSDDWFPLAVTQIYCTHCEKNSILALNGSSLNLQNHKN